MAGTAVARSGCMDQQGRRYALPFVGARTRRTIGLFLDLLQRLQLTLLLGSGGFDLGMNLKDPTPAADPSSAADLPLAVRALWILQGGAEKPPRPSPLECFSVISKQHHGPSKPRPRDPSATRDRWMWQAAHHGVVELVQWCQEHGCEATTSVCHGAASGGHLDVLRVPAPGAVHSRAARPSRPPARIMAP
ncbi:MAG: hypothetical protein AAFS07_18705 [Pseudomonadota bacterium]